jgi:beta-phosphoglucomutase
MIRHIIFDMDGVLIDSMPAHIGAWKRAFGDYGIIADENELAHLEGANYNQHFEHFEKLTGRTIDEQMRKDIHDIKLRYFHEYDIRPFMIIDKLQLIRGAGVRCAIASGSMRELVLEILERHFKGIFDCILTGDDVTRSKPDPEIYLKALSCVGGTEADTLVIENAPLGIQAAKAAGLKVYAISTSIPIDELKGADMTFPGHEGLFRQLFDELSLRN